MVRIVVKNHLVGSKFDLSLLALEDVPVKEIADTVKANQIDLSSNKIKTIPPSLCCVKHIVHLDLSKNLIESLPSNFGDLTRLQYLDVSNNRLKTLPVSFYQLHCLRWLDLKDNPLNEQLKVIVGDCLDKKQCQTCATQVVQFMTGVYNQLLQRESENGKTEIVSSVRQVKSKEEKVKVVKENTKIRADALQAKGDNRHVTTTTTTKRVSPKASGTKPLAPSNKKQKFKRTPSVKSGWGLVGHLLASILVFVSVLVGIVCYYTGFQFDQEKIEAAIVMIKYDTIKMVSWAGTKAEHAVNWLASNGWPLLKFLIQEWISFLYDVWEILNMVVDHLYLEIRRYLGLR